MKNLFIVFILFLSTLLFSYVCNPVLAVSTGSSDDYLIYDQEHGISRNGDHISLCCWRKSADLENIYELIYVYSTDNGESYSEILLEQYDLSECPPGRLYNMKRFAPVIIHAGDDTDYVYFYNLITTKPMAAFISNEGSVNEIFELPISNRNQVQVIKDGEELLAVSLGGDVFDKSLSYFEYFTENSYSENDEYTGTEPMHFWGPMEYYGDVHSNDNIWVQNGGGGNNNGWPTFYGKVTTNGHFLEYPTGFPLEDEAPMDDIFRGGYAEEAGYLDFSMGSTVWENGFDLSSSIDRDILYVKLNGNTATCRYADIITHTDTFMVYDTFPDALHAFPIGDSIWTNEVEVPETVWDDETFTVTVSDGSVLVHCELWIEGTVSGFQTWASTDTIFITNDLLYDSVTPGEEPDLSTQDMLGLISEERIYIQYKNYDPDTGEIQSPNCNDIYLYGNFMAVSDGDIELYGDMNTHFEGIFSFYYQHPHGSTPGFTYTYPGGEEWIIEYPDLHKYIFPPDPYWSGDQGYLLHSNEPIMGNNGFNTCGYPYESDDYVNSLVPPYGTDYPWYNPVYPEGSNADMGERGVISIFGGIQQYRRGFIHRSGTDPNNHQNNEWNLEEYLYGGTHGSTGYDFDNHYDIRLAETAPPDYCILNNNNNTYLDAIFEIPSTLRLYEYDEITNQTVLTDSFNLPSNQYSLIDACIYDNEMSFLLKGNESDNDAVSILTKAEDWDLIELELNSENVQSIDKYEDYYLIKADRNILVYDSDGSYVMEWSEGGMPVSTDYSNEQRAFLHYVMGSGVNEYTYYIDELTAIDESESLAEYVFEADFIPELDTPELEIYHKPDGEIVMQILEQKEIDGFTFPVYKNIYLASGNLAELPSTEENIPPADLNLTVYPNPFNPTTTISFELAKAGNVKLAVYNMKGQQVSVIKDEYMQAGKHSFMWDGSSISSGIYMLRFESLGKHDAVKLVMMK